MNVKERMRQMVAVMNIALKMFSYGEEGYMSTVRFPAPQWLN
jgi:hypothetical protein